MSTMVSLVVGLTACAVVELAASGWRALRAVLAPRRPRAEHLEPPAWGLLGLAWAGWVLLALLTAAGCTIPAAS